MTVVTSRIDPLPDPLGHDPDLVWMSPQVSMWGWGEAARFHPGTGNDRFAVARRLFADYWAGITDSPDADGGRIGFASFTFAPASAGSVLIIPEVVVVQRGDSWWCTAIDGAPIPPIRSQPEPPVDRARFAGSSVPDVLWLDAVAAAIEEIRSTGLSKVVMARDYALWSRHPFHPPRLMGHLADRFPGCHTFAVAGLVGASPEMLIRRRGLLVDSMVLAGTAPAFNDDPDADRMAGVRLAESDKDRHEHTLSVESVRDRLHKVTDSLTVAAEPELLRLSNVQHLATPVSGTLADDTHILALVELLHPTAAVGGTPTPMAMDAIERLEGMDRGRYGGPVGWLDAAGDGEFAIALRCAELSGARARLFAGAGIVDGSLPEAELEETRIKLQAMMGALGA